MEIQPKPKVIVIVGPTASGKTTLSIALAKKFNGEIISADSRQTYKKLNIGTEKITAEEMNGVPHHLLDMVDIENVYSVADYKRDASAVVDDITHRKLLPIIAGGTFFYIDALLGKMQTPEVPPNEQLRSELETKTTESLYSVLQKLDPRRAALLDTSNKRRLIRALEIVAAIGTVPEVESQECPYQTLIIGIETDKKILRERIRERAKKALTKGLVEETKNLLISGVSRTRLSEIGLEYRVIMEFIDGELTEDQLIQKLEEKNWQYAKRQLVWLKRDDNIEWYARENLEEIFARVQQFLS